MGSINCSPEPEFIEEIVEVIWKRLKGESSTVQSRRQIDNPGAGEDSSIIISQNDASSVQNVIAEWSRFLFFFFGCQLALYRVFESSGHKEFFKSSQVSKDYFRRKRGPLKLLLNLTRRLSSFFIYLKSQTLRAEQ